MSRGQTQRASVQGELLPYREYMVLLIQLPLLPFLPSWNITLVQVTCLPAFLGNGLGGSNDPRIGSGNSEPFPTSTKVYWVFPEHQIVS